MSRLPLIPSVLVGLAIAAMIALGLWQLQRRDEKEALLARLAANMGKPAIAFPIAATGDAPLFRRSSVMCLEPVAWRTQGGRGIKGTNGFRQIATCRTGAEGPGVLVDVGVTANPDFKPAWKGGEVTGTITTAPDHRPLIVALTDRQPRALMLIADQPAPGLEASAKPDLASIPNNHLAYAVQWFLFAIVAAVIYVLALRRRQRG